MPKNKTHIFIYGSLVLLTGCAHYTASTLSHLPQEGQKQNVLISWKFFDKEGLQTYLGIDVFSERYVPVQMVITNNSSTSMYLSTDNFNVPLPYSEQVTQISNASMTGRVAAWGSGGLIIWPLLTPLAYEGDTSGETNQALDKKYQSKALKEHIIHPKTTFSRVVFVPKEKVTQAIEMFLLNEKTQEKIAFSVLKRREADV